METIRYEPIETGPDALHPGDYLIIEGNVITECVWENERYTGLIGDKLPYVHAVGKKSLFLLRWKDSEGTTSESKTTFDPDAPNGRAEWGSIDIEFNNKFYGFRRINSDPSTKSPGEAHRYVVYYYCEQPKTPAAMTDGQGRFLAHNTAADFTAEDILDLAQTFEVWVSIRYNGRYLFLDSKGSRFQQR